MKAKKKVVRGRRTTKAEREKIVLFCIENEKNYNLTREMFNVSYQQIYSWVRKYEIGGAAMLADNRGRTRLDEELTEEERLRRENTKLRARIRELKARVAELESK